MINKIIYILLLNFIIIFSESAAGVNNRLERSIGIFGDYNYNIYSASFKQLPGAPSCCPQYTGGSGQGLTLGILYENDLSKNFIFSSRLIYTDLSGNLSSEQSILLPVDTGGVTPGIFSHELQNDISMIGVELALGLKIIDKLTIKFGFSGGYLVKAAFSQKEVLKEPQDGYFPETKKRTRNILSGDIKDIYSLNFGLSGGLSYDLPLNSDNSLFLTPELTYFYSLSGFVKDIDWSVSSIRAGVAVKYSPKPPIYQDKFEYKKMIDTISNVMAIVNEIYLRGKEEIIHDTSYINKFRIISEIYRRTDTIHYPRRAKFKAKINAAAIAEDVKSEPGHLQIEEFATMKMKPLLNYIFFDEGSDTIPSRYKLLDRTAAGRFTIDSLHKLETLPAYYQLLNIIGKRLNSDQESKIIIKGCNSNTGIEENNIALSRQRALAVFNYLNEVWFIDESRMIMTAWNLPENPTNVKDDDGLAENRRVEIISDSYKILNPVITNDTLRIVNFQLIRFYPETEPRIIPKNWQINIIQDGVILKRIEGSGKLPDKVDWNLSQEQNTIPRSGSPVEYYIEVTGSDGLSAVSTKAAFVPEYVAISKKREQQQIDKRIEDYSLILFDYGKSVLNKSNQRVIDFVQSRIDSASTVNIQGMTDRIGDESYNYKLSLERASSVARLLKAGSISFEGLGESGAFFDNSLPEGRFYNRTVNIHIESKVR
ncbi:MAG: hypothetical protein QG635_2136 [Bacteroidota bacterium]|nr:hypothetical protein [Bacteroidota bacterium]